MAAIPKEMKAWQKHFGSSKPVYVTVPTPSAAPDGLLIRIHAAGVCHSDVALIAMEDQTPTFPKEQYTLGHEGCGEIVQIGDEVSGFKIGDMVAIDPVVGCGTSTCGECTRDLAQICYSGERYGIGFDGSYAPYVAIKARAAVKLPEGVTAEQGAVATDACMTAYHAVVGTGKVTKKDLVVIVGIGGLGFNAMQVVQAIGSRVIVTDTRQAVLDEAVKFGIPKGDIVPIGESLIDFVKRNTLVVDVIVDFVGVPGTFNTSQEAVRMGGRIVQVGLLSKEIQINNFVAMRKHLSILCSYGGSKDDLVQCLDLIANGKLRPQVEKGKLEDFATVIDDLHAGKVKSRIALVP